MTAKFALPVTTVTPLIKFPRIGFDDATYCVTPVAITMPANVGVDVVAMFCGRLNVTLLAALATLTWLVVPVKVAAAGIPPVAPINI